MFASSQRKESGRVYKQPREKHKDNSILNRPGRESSRPEDSKRSINRAGSIVGRRTKIPKRCFIAQPLCGPGPEKGVARTINAKRRAPFKADSQLRFAARAIRISTTVYRGLFPQQTQYCVWSKTFFSPAKPPANRPKDPPKEFFETSVSRVAYAVLFNFYSYPRRLYCSVACDNRRIVRRDRFCLRRAQLS